MRFMILIKANKDSEAGVMPSRQQKAQEDRLRDQIAKQHKV